MPRGTKTGGLIQTDITADELPSVSPRVTGSKTCILQTVLVFPRLLQLPGLTTQMLLIEHVVTIAHRRPIFIEPQHGLLTAY